jgi:hemin uptake protein HemP
MSLLANADFIRSKVEHGGGGCTSSPVPPRVVDIHDLLGERREIVIVHKGENYRLRITAKDRLILTK